MQMCVVGRRLVIFGGEAAEEGAEVMVLDTDMWRWVQPKVNGTPPLMRQHFTFCSMGDKNAIVFGGRTVQSAAEKEEEDREAHAAKEQYEADLAEWKAKELAADEAAEAAEAAGGEAPTEGRSPKPTPPVPAKWESRLLSDVHMLTVDRESVTWITPPDTSGSIPEPRCGASGLFVNGMPKKIVVFGGEGAPNADGPTYFNNAFILNASNEAKFEWTALQSQMVQAEGSSTVDMLAAAQAKLAGDKGKTPTARRGTRLSILAVAGAAGSGPTTSGGLAGLASIVSRRGSSGVPPHAPFHRCFEHVRMHT